MIKSVGSDCQGDRISSQSREPGYTVAQHERFSALIFSKTAAFRHTECIPQGTVAIAQKAARQGFEVDATENAAAFTDQNLAKYDVVIFLCSGSPSSGSQQLTRQPAGEGPAVSSPPSAAARSRMPSSPYLRSPRLVRGGRAGCPGALGREVHPSVSELDRESGSCVRRMTHRVGQRLLGDPVNGDAHARRTVREVLWRPQLDVEAGRARVLDQRR